MPLAAPGVEDLGRPVLPLVPGVHGLGHPEGRQLTPSEIALQGPDPGAPGDRQAEGRGSIDQDPLPFRGDDAAKRRYPWVNTIRDQGAGQEKTAPKSGCKHLVLLVFWRRRAESNRRMADLQSDFHMLMRVDQFQLQSFL